MNALLAQFIPEARELLEQAGTGLLALERDGRSKSAVDDVFRAVHTLKGSSGLFDVAPLTRLVHAAEDLLGEVRTGALALDSEIVDRLLESLDLVSGWIDALEANETLPSDAEAKMARGVALMRKEPSEANRGVVSGKSGSGPETLTGPDAPAWVFDLSEDDRMAAYLASRHHQILAWTFRPEEDCFFRGDDPLTLVRAAPGLLTLRVRPCEPWPPLEILDPLKSCLSFEVLSDAPRDALERHVLYVADRVQIDAFAPADLAVPTGAAASGPVFAEFASRARQQIAASDAEGLSRSIEAALKFAAPSSLQASALRWCKTCLAKGRHHSSELQRLILAVETGRIPESEGPYGSSDPWPRDPQDPAANTADADAALSIAAHRLALEQLHMLQIPARPGVHEGRLEAAAAVLKNLAKTAGLDDRAEDVDAAVSQSGRGDFEALKRLVERLAGPSPLDAGTAAAHGPDIQSTDSHGPEPQGAESQGLDAGGEAKAANRVLRVDQTKIDAIMNLVAELIVAKNGLSYLATRAETVHGSRAAAREIKDQFAVIDRITQGLQVGVMSVRMMPVGQVFQRFPRLVRDVARKLGKQVRLVIEGEETEADKTVLESLADPLIHMVRNSLDHGVETPEERRAAGKPDHGTVRITARQENDFVVIEVRDDGRGVDTERVKAKALKLGLISAEQGLQMNEDEAADLIFLAGFSTKETVSDLSGRGVGMDVVRTAVARAGGEVALRSWPGAGTSLTLRLPLTMAVTRIVTIECRSRLFGVPMDHVVETVRIAKAQIRRIKTSETFVLRDTIIPIVRLTRILDLSTDPTGSGAEDEAVMVVKVGQDRVGLIVDGFRERMDVIVKPLEGILEGLHGFSGTALLGDGRVLLILDLKELL